MHNWIVVEDCIVGDIYKLESRNLSYGRYLGNGWFEGWRTKWGERFIDTELHYDYGPPYGTVKPVKKVESPAIAPSKAELLNLLSKLNDEDFKKIQDYFI